MSKIKCVGVIAEDDSDFNSVRILVKRIAGKDNIAFKKKIGDGCGKVKRKCSVWAEDLFQRQCDALIVVHDLDRSVLSQLESDLAERLSSASIARRLICIPVEELESWFLSDPKSIKSALSLSRIPKASGRPETITSPKEYLRDQVASCSGSRRIYLTTKHNELLAQHVSIELARAKCPSFERFHDFVAGQRY